MKPKALDKAVLDAADYRGFLSAMINARRTRGEKVNFSHLTRRAGFTSRSYLKEVIDGKKRIAPPSLPRFIKAFGMDKATAALFTALVAIEESDVNFENLTREQLQLRVKSLREKIGRRHSESPSLPRPDSFALGPRAVEIFAALGSSEQGALLSEVQSRTQLDEPTCRRVLAEFIDKKMVRSEDDRYFVDQVNIDLGGLGEDLSFHQLFGNVLGELGNSYRKKLASNEELFFYTAYSVRRERLPEMKKRMRELILEFIDGEQVDDGDKVVKTMFAMYL